jgi:DNA-3-methyladenine glycosylase I
MALCGYGGYIWGFVGHEPKQNTWRSIKEVPAKTPESDALSKDLKRRGFKFVGSTICYAFMQAVGIVNDHVIDCFRHGELRKAAQGDNEGRGQLHLRFLRGGRAVAEKTARQMEYAWGVNQ